MIIWYKACTGCSGYTVKEYIGSGGGGKGGTDCFWKKAMSELRSKLLDNLLWKTSTWTIASNSLGQLSKNTDPRSFSCGTTGSVASWEHWGEGSIPCLVWWVKDPSLLQLQLGSCLQLGLDPWPRSSIGCRVAKKEKISSQAQIFWFNDSKMKGRSLF